MPFFYIDWTYFLWVAPALLMAFWAQMRLKSTYAKAQQIRGPMSGAAVARHVLDSAGLTNVSIEAVPGHLSDHYDPRHQVVRLSQATYQGVDLAAAGIAAHECGHAIQHANHYAPLVVRNAAVPVANFGSQFGMLLFFIGLLLGSIQPLLIAGIALFSGVVFFQVINLPVEYNASSRAKQELVNLGIVPQEQMPMIRKVLSAAALTYVAGTLQSVLTLFWMISRADRN